ncbi:MAG: hypothetical protein KDA89_21305, partial [Planctomycetaceae bacterium]|nr:hypothetical protein [Planctomycetaceae bacterium]
MGEHETSFGDGIAEDSQEQTSGAPRRRIGRRRSRSGSARETESRDDSGRDDFGEGIHTTALDDTSSVLEEARSSRFSDDVDDADSGSRRQRPGRHSNADQGSDQGSDLRQSSEGERPRRRRRRPRRGKGPEPAGGGRSGTENGHTGHSGNGRGRHRQSNDVRSSRDRRDRDQRGRRGGGGGDRGPSPRRGRQVLPGGEAIEGTFEGVLELHPKGYGFLRDPKKNYAAEDANPFVSSSVVEKFRLREGVLIRGQVGPGSRNQGPRLLDVELIDGFTPEEYLEIKHFDELTAINPFEQIRLE